MFFSTLNIADIKFGSSEGDKKEMWAQKKFRTDSIDETNMETNVSESNKKDKVKIDGMLSELFGRLIESLDRNTEVMQCTMDTMDTLSKSSKLLPDDGDFIIPDAKRSEKVTVELKCTFLTINDIDTINQQFEAEVFVQARWEEPILQQTLFGNKDKESEDMDKMIPWDPKLIVMNIDGAFVLNRKTFDIRFHEPGYKYPVVVQLWRFKGFFKENLELEHFPVDVQDITISLSTERSDKEVELIEDQQSLSSINTKAFMDQEWSLYKHIETTRDFTTVEYCSSTVHPILHAQCRVARKMGYFVWNIIFIMLLIISLTFAAYTIEYFNPDRLNVTITLFLTAVAFKLVVKQSLPTISYLTYLMLIISLTFAAYSIDFYDASRITVTMTLFLTSVAFKLVVKQSLPTISYLTYLDVYVIAALIFLGLQATQNAMVNALGHFMKEYDVQFYDKWSMVAMAFILVIFHVIFALFIYRTASKRRRIMAEKDKMYTSKREFVEKFHTLPRRYNCQSNSKDRDSILPEKKFKPTKPR